MQQHYLMKYSDVFETTPEPRNYYRMLLRCAGDIPINIAATINSIFAADDGVEAQASLENELLSDSVKNKLRRLRRRETKGRSSIVFTRAGAMLNLKALLATDRSAGRYSVTAFGAI